MLHCGTQITNVSDVKQQKDLQNEKAVKNYDIYKKNYFRTSLLSSYLASFTSIIMKLF